jgi:ACT domain-containing protein
LLQSFVIYDWMYLKYKTYISVHIETMDTHKHVYYSLYITHLSLLHSLFHFLLYETKIIHFMHVNWSILQECNTTIVLNISVMDCSLCYIVHYDYINFIS